MKSAFYSTIYLCLFFGSFLWVSSLKNSGARHHPDRIEEASGALEALTFWTRSRAYPDVDIPPDKYLQAFTYSKSQFREMNSKMSAGTTWQFIGPGNLSGRTISVAVNPLNPTSVYVGSASGGLWHSKNGALGGDWTRVTTAFAVLGVMAIAINPSDTNIIYIGTGEVYGIQRALGGTVIRTTRGSYGIGILKTTNGGITWAKSLDWSYNQQRGIQALKINPLNTNTIYAATTEGIYKSTDAGGTWNLVLGVVMGEDILINSQDTTKIIASCCNFATPGAGIYRSTDAGANWTQVSGVPGFSGKTLLEMYALIPNVVYASVADSTTGVGGLWRSTDFGVSWILLNSASPAGVQGWYSHFVAVHPLDSSQVVWAGVGISRSINGGRTFTGSSGSYSDHHAFAHHPTNANILLVTNDDGIYRSTNFGSSFTNVSSGLYTGQFYNGFSNSAKDSLLALGQVQDHIPGYLYRGSVTWTRSAADECGWTAINQLNDSIMYAATRSGGSIRKSVNRGASFPLSWSFGGVGSWNSPFVIAPSNTNVLYFGIDRIFKTTNASGSWFATNSNLVLDGNPALSMAISYTNPDTVYVGTAPYVTRAHIFRTTNGGTSWTNITGSLPDRYPNDIAVDPTDSRKVYVAFGGFSAGHIFKSTDAGANWTNITADLPDAPATALFIDPLNPDNIYLGTDISVYGSTDGGLTWDAFNTGLPEAVLVADLSMTAANRTLRAATHGNSVSQRKLPDIPVGVGENPTVVSEFRLEQNYPNPFNPSTTIQFRIGQAGFVSLKIFDVTGREVATLVNEWKTSGSHGVSWDAGSLPSGVYVYQLAVNDFTANSKMILLK